MGHPGWDLWPIVIDPAHAPSDQGAGPYVKVGIEQGAVAEAAEKVLRLLDGRGLQLTDTQRAQVAASTDMSQLNLWFDRAISAETAADVFKD